MIDKDRLGFGLDVMGNLNENLRLGVAFRYGREQYIGGTTKSVIGDSSIAIGGEEISNFYSIALMGDLVPKPVNKILASRFEYYFGGGNFIIPSQYNKPISR